MLEAIGREWRETRNEFKSALDEGRHCVISPCDLLNPACGKVFQVTLDDRPRQLEFNRVASSELQHETLV